MKWYELDMTKDAQYMFLEMEEPPPIEVVLDRYNGVEWVGGTEEWGYDEGLDLYVFFFDFGVYALKIES